jgi:tetratricopeptide (TPR) repeat protein
MLVDTLASVWRLLARETAGSSRALNGKAAIHRYSPDENYETWARCRVRAEFHLGRARRAKDRGNYRAAAREIERALRHDDTSEAYYQVLAQCHFKASPSEIDEARRALAVARALDPDSGYTSKLLAQVCETSRQTPEVGQAQKPPWSQAAGGRSPTSRRLVPTLPNVSILSPSRSR